jgi:hypothetical protein
MSFISQVCPQCCAIYDRILRFKFLGLVERTTAFQGLLSRGSGNGVNLVYDTVATARYIAHHQDGPVTLHYPPVKDDGTV